MHTYFIYKLFVSSLGSAVNILLVTPEKAIKLTANDAFRYVLLNKQGYIEAGSLLIF
jgi:solute carrier family 25 glutamate transporter 18/22